ncbi:hypothetical protein BH09MYX1_BH09MYX1_62420 [soil metagenome]
MDRIQHRRFLDYRETLGYFGKQTKALNQTEFSAADDEYRALTAKGEARDDEEEARLAELAALLLRD